MSPQRYFTLSSFRCSSSRLSSKMEYKRTLTTCIFRPESPRKRRRRSWRAAKCVRKKHRAHSVNDLQSYYIYYNMRSILPLNRFATHTLIINIGCFFLHTEQSKGRKEEGTNSLYDYFTIFSYHIDGLYFICFACSFRITHTHTHFKSIRISNLICVCVSTKNGWKKNPF